MKNLITTDLGGQPLYYKDFEFIQEQIRELSKANFAHLDNDIVNILNGAEFTLSTDGYTIDITTEGWAWYNGEYYYIPTQSVTGATPNVLKWYIEESYDARGLKTFEDATVGQKEVYKVNVLKLNYVSGVIDAPLFSETKNVQIVQASESEQGIIQLATGLEVLTGSDDEKAVTPATLRGLKANKLEVIAGIENKYVTGETLQTSESWTSATLIDTRISQNSTFPLQYKKDSAGGVWVSGIVIIDTGTLNTLITLFTLPLGYLVSNRGFFAPAYTNNGVTVRVRYDNSPLGEITINPLGSGLIVAGDQIGVHFYIPKDA